MNTLYVIDVSAVVHTVAHVPTFSDRTFYNYPVGGIHYLMRYVSIAFSARDDVLLCFDSPCFRKDLFPEYKNGRSADQRVISQLETLYEGLMACGVPCAKQDGYEADDLIHWAVKQHYNSYAEIVIIGNDHDLCHEVQNKVRFKTIRLDQNNIYTGNFENSIISGVRIYFNTISAYKVFTGCPSDHIPSFKSEFGASGKELYDDFIDMLNSMNIRRTYANTTNPDLLRVYVKYSELLSDKDKIEMEKRIQLIYPAENTDNVQLPVASWSELDHYALFHFLTLYNDRDSLRCLGGSAAYLSEDEKQELREKARALVNGEYAADHDIDNAPKLKTTSLQLDAFTKDF